MLLTAFARAIPVIARVVPTRIVLQTIQRTCGRMASATSASALSQGGSSTSASTSGKKLAVVTGANQGYVQRVATKCAGVAYRRVVFMSYICRHHLGSVRHCGRRACTIEYREPFKLLRISSGHSAPRWIML